MKYEITSDVAFPLIRFELQEGEKIKAESGAMVAMSEGMELTGKMDGGFLRGVARKFSGESFFMQQIEAVHGNGWALLAAATPGGIATVDVSGGSELLVQKDGYLAATPDVQVSTKMQSLSKGLFSGEGFFVVKVFGEGTVFLSTYGSIYSINIAEGETVLIDNGHLVAWDASMKYEITKGAKTWFSSMTSGEGFACRFRGPGRVLIQTRNPQQLAGWLFPFLPIPKTAAR
ncbi:MAG: TIGR00266 family protein [Alphaproteobacteria bacterium]|nr:TIGR00266 family protein [Alphaproteobacteria bacterium]